MNKVIGASTIALKIIGTTTAIPWCNIIFSLSAKRKYLLIFSVCLSYFFLTSWVFISLMYVVLFFFSFPMMSGILFRIVWSMIFSLFQYINILLPQLDHTGSIFPCTVPLIFWLILFATWLCLSVYPLDDNTEDALTRNSMGFHVLMQILLLSSCDTFIFITCFW